MAPQYRNMEECDTCHELCYVSCIWWLMYCCHMYLFLSVCVIVYQTEFVCIVSFRRWNWEEGHTHTHTHTFACKYTYIHPVQVIPQSLWLQAHLQLASLGWCHKWEECTKPCAHRSVCSCNESGGCASILADPFIARLGVGCHPVISKVLGDLCCLRSVAAASGWAEVDTWPLLHGGCYHVTEVGGPYGWETHAEGCHLKSHGICWITRGTPCDISGFCHGIVEAFILGCYTVQVGTGVKALYILALPTQVNTSSL